MRASDPVGDTGDDLGFVRAAREILEPVLVEFGFALAEAGSRSVRFESDHLWAWVFHEDGPSQAIGFRFGRLDRPDEGGTYGVPDAMKLVNPAAAAEYEEPRPRASREVRVALESLERDIQTYCGPALRGDIEVFAAMKGAQDLHLTQYSEWTRRSKEMGRGAAIDRGDWALVVRIYECAEQDLNSLQERKFLIAKQNVRTLRYCDPEWCDEQLLRAALSQAYASYGYFDGTAAERERVERAVGEAMDARDWKRVIEVYEFASYELEYLERTRLEIARRQLGEFGGDPSSIT